MLSEAIFVDEHAWSEEWSRRKTEQASLQHCSRCIYAADIPGIEFDDQGVCTYCRIHDDLERQYDCGPRGKEQLETLAAEIRRDGRRKPYDVIVGVSGGCDSSYLLHLARELDLRPLAVHFDNTWNSTIAVENISNVLGSLGVELWTYVVDNTEYDDLYRSFLQAGVPDLECPTDIGLATTLNLAANKFGVRYVFEGHSYRTEGISPLGWLYMDAKYIQSVQRQYGTRNLKTFPNLWLSRQLRWMICTRLKKYRPLWYLDYHKEEVKAMLANRYGWQWYGGHHLENRMTNFYHTFFMPRRFNIDGRQLGYAALVRSGQMAREEGLALLKDPPACDRDLVEMVIKRLGLSEAEFLRLMTLPKRTYREFKTYKPTFERMRPFFYLMAKLNLIPMSFYIKYTVKEKSS